MSREDRKAMILRDHPDLSLSRQCRLLTISRSSFYYALKGESPENLALMRRIDELFLKYPFYGSRQMARDLRREGIEAGLQGHGFRSGAVALRLGPYTGHQLDPTSVVSRLLYRVWCNPGDPASDDLIECNGLAKCSSGQNTNLGYGIMPLHIIGRVGFRISLGLRIG